MNAPIAFGFDFDHTLGVDNGLERTAFADYAAALGAPYEAHGAVAADVDALLARFRAGALTLEDMVGRFGALVGAHVDADRWRAICYALVDRLVRPVDGAIETLAALRARGIPLAVLTNGWSPLQQRKIARALGDGAISPILVSDEVGAVKPDAAAFAPLVDALGVPRERVWYVGDNPRGDVGGALAAGLRAVWFDWEGLTYPPDVPPPTLRIGALRELEALALNTLAP